MVIRFAILAWFALLCAQAEEPATVVLDGRELWTVKTGRLGFSAKERAEDIRSNFDHVGQDPRRHLNDLREIHTDTESILLVGRVYLFSVTAEDARAEGIPKEQLFAQRKQIALAAIQRYRDERQLSSLLRTVGVALSAIIVAVGVVWLIWLGYRRVSAGLENQLSRMVQDKTHLSTAYNIFRGPVILLARLILRAAFVCASLIVGISALSYILGLIPTTAAVAESTAAAAGGVLRTLGAAVVGYLPNLLILIAILVLTYGALRTARAAAEAIESDQVVIPGFHADWAHPTYGLVKILMVMFALVIAFPYLPGGDSQALKGASIFIGVLVSLGSGSAMGNVISGVILTYMRPFREGDRVRIADTEGDIVERSLLVTRIRTIKNVEIIIPNSSILGAHIINYSANSRIRGLIVHTTITIGYDAPWKTVHELLIRAAKKTVFIADTPAPFVFQTSLNDYHVSYQINAFTNEPNRMAEIYSALHSNIQDEFNRGGVEIMSPTYFSLRDGNTVTIPADHREAGYVAPMFRVRTDAQEPERTGHGAASKTAGVD